ncbi:MAG: biotin/lipoyl-binding protein [Coriobacteriia bacterium]
MSKKSKAIIAVVAVLAVGGAGAAFAVSTSGVHDVEVADVTNEDLAVVVSAAGAVEADTRVDVYPPTAGTLATLDVAEGDEVRAGQVLATMDTAPIEIQIAQAEAAYRGAIAQRSAITNSAPGSSDLKAAQAAVDAAWSGYSLANAAYEAAQAGIGAPSASDIAQAQALVGIAQTSATTAQSAYDSFYTNVYLPAPEPRDATLESTLVALAFARDQAAASLVDAQTALAALLAASDNSVAIAQTKVARDQAYAAYLGAQSQRDALARASNVSGALASADAAVAAAESALAFASETLERAQIVAPIDGVVLFSGSSATSLFSATGAGGGGGGSLSVGASVTPASAPFAIVSFETLAFKATVDEADIARVEEGMSARILLDGIAATEFTAEVVNIGIESQLTATGGTAFPVLLRFQAQGEPVLLGMNGSTDIEVETIGSATTMPIEALLEDGDSTYVYTVRDGRAGRTDIEVGRMTDTRVEILSGLVDSDEVIVSGVAELTDGARVQAERQ